MVEISYAAFWDELQKIAFSMADIEHTLARSKGMIQKLPTKVPIMQMGPAAFHSGMVHEVQLPALRAAAAAGQVPVAQAEAMANTLGHLSDKITMPQRTGGVVGMLGKMGIPGAKKMPGEAKKATEAIMRAHEMDEMAQSAKAAKNPLFAAKMTHAHPDVLLREHNRVVTLPENIREPVSALHGHVRQFLEQPVFEQATRGVGGEGLQLAQGQRLSRHARRHISDRMQQIVAEPSFPTIAERMAGQ